VLPLCLVSKWHTSGGQKDCVSPFDVMLGHFHETVMYTAKIFLFDLNSQNFYVQCGGLFCLCMYDW
jgi:hypothetical protein